MAIKQATQRLKRAAAATWDTVKTVGRVFTPLTIFKMRKEALGARMKMRSTFRPKSVNPQTLVADVERLHLLRNQIIAVYPRGNPHAAKLIRQLNKMMADIRKLPQVKKYEKKLRAHARKLARYNPQSS